MLRPFSVGIALLFALSANSFAQTHLPSYGASAPSLIAASSSIPSGTILEGENDSATDSGSTVSSKTTPNDPNPSMRPFS